MKNKLICFFCFCIFAWFSLLPWGSATHKFLVDQSVFKSIPFGLEDGKWLKILNMDKGFFYNYFNFNNEQYDFMQIIDKGAELEDKWVSPFSMRRSDNHFHNPLLAFASAGLSDIASGQSMAVWAQDGTSQDPYPEKDQSWEKVREFYFTALIADNDNEKTLILEKMFKGIGHQIHLVQDAAVPDHVRNDTHLLNGDPFGFVNKKAGSFRCIEGWADWNANLIYSFSDNPIFPAIHFNHILYTTAIPISNLIDSNYYDGTNPTTSMTQGLAEYTNANFISEDTICTNNLSPDHKHYFPFPKFSSTDLDSVIAGGKAPEYITAFDNKQDYVRYIKKVQNGTIMDHFLKLGYFSTVNPLILERSLFIDDLCHKDYASMLVPRAVGYSAALINYFFRGEIEISLPADGIYSLCTDPIIGFDRISLLARNITSNNEEMKKGHVSLVLSYRLGSSSPFVPDPPIPGVERFYKTYQYINPIDLNDPSKPVDIPIDTPIRLDFDLTSPLPTDAVDVNLTIVFKGDLGAELTNAVAIGFKDISEPTPVDLFNNTDLVCFGGNYVTYTDPALLQQVDTNHNGRIDCDQAEINIIPTEITPLYLSFNGISASSTNYYYKFPETDPIVILPYKTKRFYFLGDDSPAKTRYSVKVKAENYTGSSITWAGVCPTFFDSDPVNAYSYFNKLVWRGDHYDPSHGGIGTLRGNNYYNILIFKNISVPESSTCTFSSLGLTQTVGSPTENHDINNENIPKIIEKDKSKLK
jgi:hypothetical protein